MDAQDRWDYIHLHDVHRKRLEVIQSQNSKRIDNTLPETLKLFQTKYISFLQLKNRETQTIYKRNQVLLDALQEINKRKKKNLSVAVSSTTSLNSNKRKKEIEKLIKENELIYEKLLRKESTLSMRKLEQDYQTALKYKKNASKKHIYEVPEKPESKKKLPKLKKKKNKKDKKNKASEKPGFVLEIPNNLEYKEEQDIHSEKNRKDKEEKSFEDAEAPECEEKYDEILDQVVDLGLIKQLSMKEILDFPGSVLKSERVFKTESPLPLDLPSPSSQSSDALSKMNSMPIPENHT